MNKLRQLKVSRLLLDNLHKQCPERPLADGNLRLPGTGRLFLLSGTKVDNVKSFFAIIPDSSRNACNWMPAYSPTDIYKAMEQLPKDQIGIGFAHVLGHKFINAAIRFSWRNQSEKYWYGWFGDPIVNVPVLQIFEGMPPKVIVKYSPDVSYKEIPLLIED